MAPWGTDRARSSAHLLVLVAGLARALVLPVLLAPPPAMAALDPAEAQSELERAEAACLAAPVCRSEAVEHYKRAAALGSPEGTAGLALVHWNGWTVKADQPKARMLGEKVRASLIERSKAGDARASYYLGEFFLAGIGSSGSWTMATTYLRRAAEGGLAWGQCSLGELLIRRGSAVDVPGSDPVLDGLDWVRRAAGQGLPRANFLLGQWYADGHAGSRKVPRDAEIARPHLERAVAGGYPGAQAALAALEAREAERSARATSRAGNAEAIAESMRRAEEAYFREYDDAAAARHYERAAELGSLEGQAALAKLVRLGLGVEADRARAARLAAVVVVDLEAKARADARDAAARYYLSELYRLGLGVLQDEREAARWNWEAAALGLPWAQANLAVDLIEGEVYEKNPASALDWARKASGQGYAHADYLMGGWYLAGAGVEADRARGVALLRQAAERGSKDAIEKLRDLGEPWTPGAERAPVELVQALPAPPPAPRPRPQAFPVPQPQPQPARPAPGPGSLPLPAPGEIGDCGVLDCDRASLDDIVAATLAGHPPPMPGSTPAEIVFPDLVRETLDRLRVETVEDVSRSAGSDPTDGVEWLSGTEKGVVFLRPPGGGGIVLGRASSGDSNSIRLDGEADRHVVGGAHTHPTLEWRAGESAAKATRTSNGELSLSDIASFIGRDRWIFSLAIADTGRVFLALRTRATDASHSGAFIRHLGHLFDCWIASGDDAGLALLTEFLQIELYEGDSRGVRRRQSEEHRVEALRLRTEKRIGPEEEARRLARWERVLLQAISRFKKGYYGPLDGVLSDRQREMIREFQRSMGEPETGFITRLQRARLYSEAKVEWDADGPNATVHVGFPGRLVDGATGTGVQVQCNSESFRDGTWTSERSFEGYEEKVFADGTRYKVGHGPSGIEGSQFDGTGREIWRGGFLIHPSEDKPGVLLWSRHGAGTYFFPTGELWEGRAEKGKWVGEGVLVYRDGERRRAAWKWNGSQNQLQLVD